jgi:two-component system, LytTR family, response regulator LytT
MKLLIVEDEALLARQLITLVSGLEPSAQIAGQTASIETTVEWLQTNPAPDLVFMDIELADGQCFEIFNRYPVKSPVIFTTAYDEYALRAFKVNSIDYLLKPVQVADLRAALVKWKELKAPDLITPSLAGISTLVNDLLKGGETTPYKERFLVKQGQKMRSVNREEVAFFQAKNTLNYITNRSKQKFLLDYTLDEVESMVPARDFFRANRQYILAHDIITAFHPWFNGKLKVDISLPVDEEIIISREKASQFRAWMGA